jgi:hypothetical protein
MQGRAEFAPGFAGGLRASLVLASGSDSGLAVRRGSASVKARQHSGQQDEKGSSACRRSRKLQRQGAADHRLGGGEKSLLIAYLCMSRSEADINPRRFPIRGRLELEDSPPCPA